MEQTVVKKTFSKKEAISFGWNIVKQNFLFFIILLAVSVLIIYVPSLIRLFFPRDNMLVVLVFGIISLVTWVVNIEMQVATTKISLDLYQGKKPQFSQLFSYFDKYLLSKFLGGSILVGLVVILGMLLLVIPGIIFAVRLSFYSYFIIEKGLGPVAALQASWEMTKGNFWNLVFFTSLLGLINIAGVLAIVIGLFITIPLSAMAKVFVYKKLSA